MFEPHQYPATAAQRGMFLHYTAHPLDPSFDLGFVFRIGGEADVDRLIRAARAAIDATPAFATTFPHSRAGVVAVVGAGTPRVLDLDWTEQPVASLDERIVRETERILESGPIPPESPHQMTARVYRASGASYLTLVTSHLVSDAYSFYRVVQTFADLYAAPEPEWPGMVGVLAEHPGTVASPPVTERALTRYRTLLEDLPSAGRLPVARNAEGRIRGSLSRSLISGAAALRVRNSELFQRHGAATVFFAAHASTLSRLTGSPTVVLGVPVAGRAGHRAKDAVGFFVNTLPLPVRLRAEQSWGELCADVSSGIRVLQMNQGVDLAGADSGRVLDGKLPPLDNAVTVYKQELSLPLTGLEVTALPLERASLPYPLTVTVSDDGEDFTVDVAVADELAGAGAVEHFHRAVATLARTPEALVVEGSVFLDGADATAATPLSEPGVADRPTVIDAFVRVAAAEPDAIAVQGDGESVAYGALLERARSVAEALATSGASDLVIVRMRKSVDTIAAILGVLFSGRAYVPVDPEAPPRRAELILRRVRDELGREPTTIGERGGEVHPRELIGAGMPGRRDGRALTDPLPDPLPSARAYVIFTSGSTGEPKGVVIPHRALSALLDSAVAPVGYRRGDRWCLFHSLAFDFSVWEIFGPLTSGGTLVIPREDEVARPDAFARFLRRERIGILNQTPSAFRRLTDALGRMQLTLPDVSVAVFGGEALYPADLRTWRDRVNRRTRLVNMYGITETTVHVTAKEIDPATVDAEHRSLIGEPLAHLDAVVVDACGRRAPTGVPGELVVVGDSLAEGYLGRPDLTASRFRTVEVGGVPRRGYVTGDRVRRDRDGELAYLGRVDDQVQLRGYRIELGEIESAIAASGRTSASVALVVEPEGREPFLCAWIVPVDAASWERELRAELASRLPGYMIPAALVAVPALPMTQNGKPDLARLPLPSSAPKAAAADVGLAGRIASVWAETIGAGGIRVDDRFLDVGGTSMHVMEVHDRLRTELGLEDLTLVDMFEYATPADLADHILAHQRG